MDINRFWELNEGLAGGDAAEALTARLNGLEPAEVASYQEHFDGVFESAYRWPLWAAAYIIGGGCSDDGFMDFRYGLIARGRAVFEAALADPESLVGVAGDTDAGYIPNEAFGYVAGEVYESKTGQPMPDNGVAHAFNPAGEEWDFDDVKLCAQKLPKLWAKFGV